MPNISGNTKVTGCWHRPHRQPSRVPSAGGAYAVRKTSKNLKITYSNK